MGGKELQKEFEKETDKLGSCTVDFIKNFYPSYSVNNKIALSLPMENSVELLNTFTFYKICECTIYNVQDKMAFFSEKMKKLFTTAYSIKQEVCYGIVSDSGTTSLLLGVAPTSDSRVIKTVVEGLLPGMKIEKFEEKFINSKSGTQQGAKDKDRYVGCVCGVPALKVDGELQNKDLSSIMRSLNGQNYTIMVLCAPIDEREIQNKLNEAIKIRDECFAISKRTISLQNGKSNGVTHTNTYNESNGNQSSENKGGTLSGGAPGALLGFALGGPAGGLIGSLVGQSFSISKSKTSGTIHSITEGYSDAISKTISENKSISGDIQNGFAIELMNMAEVMIERLKVGRSIGMWESVVSYSSDSKITSDIIRGGLYSEIASMAPEILPPVVFSYKDSCVGSDLPIDKIHNQQLLIPKNFFNGDSQSPLCSMVTSEEICGICTIPIDNTVGFEINVSKNYALNFKLKKEDKEIGVVCEYERPLPNVPFGLSEYDLNKHTFVCGITGSGKSNTVKKILDNVDKPFLVIEPVKKEYRNLKKQINVYTLGRPEINCLKINPFYIYPGISPQLHIDLLKDLFNVSFALYGPMPFILEKCLNNIYAKKGWNLTLGFHPLLISNKHSYDIFDEDGLKEKYKIESHKYVFPTMQDLKDEIDYYIENEMTYEGEVKGNIRGAMKARIDSLCIGSKGYMFNTHDMMEIDSLMNENTVLELEGLADDSDKAFALGLLIIYVNEYRQVKKEIDGVKGLKHLLVIEEAHRLLKNVSTERNEDIGNSKGKAVEHFTNLLAEMRSYGQGVIIAEQIPSKLAPDVIKNSSNKIIHRTIAKDDQEIIANTIGIYPEDAIYLGNSKVGYALCHKEGMLQPVIVKISEVPVNEIKDIKLYNSRIEERMLQINQSIIENQMSKEIMMWAVKLLVSLLYKPSEKEIYNGIESAYEQIKHSAMINSIIMIPGVHKRECILNSLISSIKLLLITGVFSNKKLPSNQFIDLIECVIITPTQERLNNLQAEFERYYGTKPTKKVVETIGGILSKEFSNGMDIKNSVNEFNLVNTTDFHTDVIDFLNREGGR